MTSLSEYPHLTLVPSPAGALTAEQLVAKVKENGGRIYRMRQVRVFVLTSDVALAEWLIGLGGKGYTPSGSKHPPGAYMRTRQGPVEYDVWVHTIPLSGPTLWEALGADA
jgi:hypothetical protein